MTLPDPAPGASVAEFIKESSMWREILSTVRKAKRLRPQGQGAGSGGSLSICGYAGGTLEPFTLAHQKDFSPPPNANAFQWMYSPTAEIEAPTWHSTIYNVHIVPNKLKENQVTYLNGRMGVVKLSTTPNVNYPYLMVDPDNPHLGKTGTGGLFKILGFIEEEYAFVDVTENQPLWKFETTAESTGNTAQAKLLNTDNSTFADTVTLTAPEALGYASGTKGWCLHSKNLFVPISTGGGGDVAVFELTADPVLGNPTIGTCDLTQADDESSSIETDVDVYFNKKMFDDLVVGGCGVCVKDSITGQWVAQNAVYVGSQGPVNPNP